MTAVRMEGCATIKYICSISKFFQKKSGCTYFRMCSLGSKGSKTKFHPKPKVPHVQELELPEETRRGAKVRIRVRHTARAEPEPTVAEEEVRRVQELAIGVKRVLVARAVDPQIVVVYQPLRMRQQHDANLERAETELITLKHRPCPTDRLAPMFDAELRINYEDVMPLLLRSERLESVSFLRRFAQALRAQLAFAEVDELAVPALRLKRRKHEFDRFAVRWREALPLRNRERPFRTISLGRRQSFVARPKLREITLQRGDLLGDGLRCLVAGQVAVGRLDLFAREILRRLELDEQLLKAIHKLIAFCENAIPILLGQLAQANELLNACNKQVAYAVLLSLSSHFLCDPCGHHSLHYRDC